MKMIDGDVLLAEVESMIDISVSREDVAAVASLLQKILNAIRNAPEIER